MIVRIIKISFLLSFCFFIVNAQNKIKFSGNKIFSSEQLSRISGLDSSTDFPDSLLQSAEHKLNEFMFNLGYFNFKIIFSKNQNNLFALVTEGEQFKIDKVICVNNRNFDNYFKKLSGHPASDLILKNEFQNILNRTIELGYASAEIKINTFRLNKKNNTVTYWVELSLGEKNKFDKLIITGNTKTKYSWFTNLLRFQFGKTFNKKLFREIKTVLLKTDYFSQIKNISFSSDSDKRGILNIHVVEKNTNYFDGIIGYTGNKSAKSSFSGFVKINLKNLFGTGRGLKINWEKTSANQQKINLNYSEPYIFNLPLSGNFVFSQNKIDSLFIKQGFKIKSNWHFNSLFSGGLTFSSDKTIPALNNKSINKSSNLSYGINLSFDSRNSFFYPTEGTLLNLEFLQISKKVSIPELSNRNFRLQSIFTENEFYKIILSELVLSIKLRGKKILGSGLELSDAFQLGGNNSLRGYKENQFYASEFALTNSELRYLLDNFSYAFIFFDFAYFSLDKKNTFSQTESNRFLIGYGLGLRIKTKIGIVGFSYALGKDDSFSNGKIHLGLSNEF